MDYGKDSERAGGEQELRLYDGEGTARVKFFRFGAQDAPVKFLTYTFPPGSSEGLHVHAHGSDIGAYDEYYYVVSGAGEMTIAGETIAIAAGDHVFAPLGVPHGVTNTSPKDLKILLTYVQR
jgi:mannose-6-phosphate isomerase-like protein (cupin superfamily)